MQGVTRQLVVLIQDLFVPFDYPVSVFFEQASCLKAKIQELFNVFIAKEFCSR